MEVSWSNRLTKTAGITKCKRTTRTQTGTEGRCISTHYDASISLSKKVIDSSYRLRDTLIHEMCHAAVWLLNNANESHGPYWKSWAARARRTHPELPSIDRCHNYDIEYKFIYECSRCKSTIGRHSKSIDIEKKLCGRCRGKLVLTKPSKTPGKLQNEKPLNPFATFVKENYKLTKLGLQSNLRADSHKDVMTALSEKFKTASLS
uniref:SprT-like domain-containing protein n=1 Tax=Ciona savignyi TaxID=51511 RepID=H2Z9Z2_CIOSA